MAPCCTTSFLPCIKQVRETRMLDMVSNLERARMEGVPETERVRCLESIRAEAGRMRCGRDAEAAASILARVCPPPYRSLVLS
jgi:hypothetical protein